MGFYYISIFSIIPLGIAYGLLALAYWGIVRATRGTAGRKAILSIVGVIFLILPIGEELWIAWNFGQACKEAGTFIHKKVRVEGFYDETGTGSLELVRSGTYQFVESPGEKGPTRLTRGDAGLIREVFARFEKEHPGKDPSTQDIVRVKLEDDIEALVFPKKGDSWRITKLDRPTARYRFRDTDPTGGTPWGHKIARSGTVVMDSDTNQEIARYARFFRNPPWFFSSIGTPGFACDAPGRWPRTSGSYLIYLDVLQPIGK